MKMVVKTLILDFNLTRTLVMKKIYITLAVLSLAAIMNTACDNREDDIEGKTELGSDAIAFSLSGVTTRAEVSDYEASEEVNIIPLGTDENNNNFFLEESVIDLEAPVTRGTPAYTENVMELYGDEISTYSPALPQDGEEFVVKYNGESYVKSFGREIWPEDDSPLEFYMRMPSAISAVTSEYTYSHDDNGNGTIKFSYSSPDKAADQQDILFTYRKIKKSEYVANNNKVDVLFHHALTGVKFATKNAPGDAVTIKSVTFTGLVDNGTCTVTPIAENDGQKDVYTDVTTDYSSASAVVWSLGDTPVTPGKTITSEAFPLDDNGKNILVNFPNDGSSYAFPASFSNKGNENNLNDKDATQTFWLIPQTMNENVKLTIEYTVKGANEVGTDGTWTIDFGKALSGLEWKAGQLRTYTIKVDDVNVKIEDKVTVDGNDENGYSGSIKKDVVITNTGNTDAFIRAAIIRQWLDEEGNPVFGFTDAVNSVYAVESWYEDQFETHAGKHGAFVDLAGYSNTRTGVNYDNTVNNWFYNSFDRYYYYTKVVPVDGTTEKLFESYTVATAPIVELSGVNTKVYFVLEIATQAISARKDNSKNYADSEWQTAWNNAKATN